MTKLWACETVCLACKACFSLCKNITLIGVYFGYLNIVLLSGVALREPCKSLFLLLYPYRGIVWKMYVGAVGIGETESNRNRSTIDASAPHLHFFTFVMSLVLFLHAESALRGDI